MKKLIILIIIIFLIFISLAYYNPFNSNELDNTYCKVYAEQLSIKARYERGEKQYYINSEWIDEDILIKDCLKKEIIN